jgi:16S rRNA (guanine527-N7)-methyltransferase
MKKDIPQNTNADFLLLKDNWDLGGTAQSAGLIWEDLRSYIHILYSWSKKMNLVGLNDIDVLATKHLWRALVMLPHIQSVSHDTIIDVGSGSGLPAIPLKICLPGSQFYLVESRRKRANYLREVIRSLGLKKIEVINERIENWKENIVGDVVTARAVANPTEIKNWVTEHIAANSWLICTLEKSGLGPTEGGREVLCEWRGESMKLGVIPLTCKQSN